MPFFRLHRGSLADSMATVREIQSVADINTIIAPDVVVSIQHGRYDSRINWDTYFVISQAGVVGMTNTYLPVTQDVKLNPTT